MHELAHRAVFQRIEVHLLERRAHNREIKEHLIHLRIILLHLVGDLVVHVLLDALSLLHKLLALRANNVHTNRATSRKQLPVRLSLKLRHSLGQNRVNNAARTLKRLRALLIFHAQIVKALTIRLFPLLARSKIVLNATHKLRRNATKVHVVNGISQVAVKRDVNHGLLVHDLAHNGTAIVHLEHVRALRQLNKIHRSALSLVNEPLDHFHGKATGANIRFNRHSSSPKGCWGRERSTRGGLEERKHRQFWEGEAGRHPASLPQPRSF